ncbi:MAG: type I-F CRISPR-associated endoribonuclease Cas6/Csy4 [Gammaproteobacteria bacterium]|nr:type I-F CRISPR-associated endoribonuclease Cas6/Csy4 [Gammaproteobacteria bacterium]MBU1477980.1 type I-F CRISPR-associated endoribonuclease Cas6/Csy4 [Gammaproteobacteria bacterium]MBU2000878.1 type I-F CRISPR-associated endoribonuclease Cas6/Csy4 [Gammaproteobacteria bacterium]MBU2132953.1 type I-F CRISPR-associated endoribonuclease Cas6/Csy4 [Gammaproteobacteria bacterium]MBU2186693.1 type I-F CRISPR-associated endoribonuclease Cas6/Csy4 [Gammaproteobacteria bacterium]
MQRYYFMVRFLPQEANLALLMGRCISVMHGYICKHEIKGLGVTFPAWSDASIGNVIAFVHSDEIVLSELKQQSYFQDMKECGFFSLGNVDVVPNDCAEVMFKRNQAIAKIFVGEARRRLKRLEKRALARGETFNPIKNTQPREFSAFHRIAMSSGSNKQDYLLHIQKMVAKEQTEPLFSSYGFASNLQQNGTVPELSRLVDKI